MFTIGDILYFLFLAAMLVSILVAPFLMIRNYRRESRTLNASRKLMQDCGEDLQLSEDVVSMPLPAGMLGIRSSIAAYVVGMTSISFFVILLLFYAPNPQSDFSPAQVMAVLLGIFGLIITFFGILFLLRLRRARRYLIEQKEVLPNRLCLEALQQARIPLVPGRNERSRSAWFRFTEAMKERDVPAPRTAVEVLYLPVIKQIKAINDLQEPVPILPGTPRLMRQSIAAVLICLLLTLYLLVTGQWWIAAVTGGLTIYYAATTPAIRNAIPALRIDSMGTLAGPGFIRNRKGQIWRHDDSMLMVRSADRRRKSLSAVQALFMGPEGQWSLVFPSTSDPDFQLLWALWNTSNPRPELAGAEF